MSSPRSPQTFLLASTVLTAGFAGAGAASPVNLVSEVPTGYTPLTFTPGAAASGSFDVSGAGFGVVNVSGKDAKGAPFNFPANLSLQGAATTTEVVYDTAAGANGIVLATASPFAVAPGNNVNTAADVLNKSNGTSDFSATPAYGEIVFSENGTTMDGYFEATYANNTFTLLDYGLVTVPEPASLALLATGMAGIAALRRRCTAC